MKQLLAVIPIFMTTSAWAMGGSIVAGGIGNFRTSAKYTCHASDKAWSMSITVDRRASVATVLIAKDPSERVADFALTGSVQAIEASTLVEGFTTESEDKTMRVEVSALQSGQATAAVYRKGRVVSFDCSR